MSARSKEEDGPESLLEPGSTVDHFKVVRLLGRGGMGEVYLARDTKLGRRVALKLVRPNALASADARERFLFEARVTARFSHPNIVAVHSVGEHRGSPYLALEYLAGRNLFERCRSEPPAFGESLRIGAAVAEALAEAHRHEVLHRDLKPENILLPRDGRPRVVDFGLAKRFEFVGPVPDEGLFDSRAGLEAYRDSRLVSGVETDLHVLMGTPPYMAPEQWRGEPCTGATDVWALGVILFELLAGRPPFAERKIAALALAVCGPEPAPRLGEAVGLPDDVDELVGRCLAKDPAERPTAAELAAALLGLLPRARAQLAGDESPYRGLLPFTERHAGAFYGRDDEVAAFVERLREEPLVAIVGPSGAGKSSFVRAGVVPRLREQGRWVVLTLRPGRDPMASLATRIAAGWRLAESSAPPPDLFGDTVRQSVPGALAEGERRASGRTTSETGLASSLAVSPALLSVVLGRLAEQQRSRVLLLVDQLEEVFTQGGGEAEREAFLEAVCSAADDPEGPVRVVLTLREDFLGHVARARSGRLALGQVTVLGTPPVETLREVAARPLERVGHRFEEPGLPSEMAERVAGEPAALVLLQFTCLRLWEERDRERRLLTRASYEELGGVEGALARHADRVVEGLAPAQLEAAKQILLRLVTPEGTRRVQPRASLLEGLGPEAAQVLDRLVSWRAVTASRGTEGAEADLELVHESLVSRWDRLARWIDESREELAFLAEVGKAAELWEGRGRRREEVWRGPALDEARFRAARCAALPDGVRRFLEAGEALGRRSARRRTVALGGVIATLAVVVGVLFVQEQATRAARDDAERERAEALVEGARAALVAGDPLEARAKLRTALEVRDSALGRMLWWQLEREPRLWTVDLPTLAYSVAISPDGREVAATCAARSVYLVEVATGRTKVLRGHEEQVASVAYSPDGRMLASGDIGGTTALWDLETGRPRRLRGHAGIVTDVEFSAEGARLLTASRDGTVRSWNARTGAPEDTFRGHEDWVVGVHLAPDGRSFRSVSRDRTLRDWRLGEPASGRVLHRDAEALGCMAPGPDGTLALCAGREIRLVDAGSGEVRGSLVGHRALVTAAARSPRGDALVSGDEDGRVLHWELPTGSIVQELAGRGARQRSAAFGGDGRLVATAAEDGTVSLWDLGVVSAGARPARPHGEQIEGLAWMDDDRRVATGGYDGRVLIWDAASGERVSELARHEEMVGPLAVDPGGRTLAVGVGDSVGLWDLERLAFRGELGGHAGDVWSVAWSPDGRRLASGSSRGEVRVWDVPEAAVAWRRGGLAGPLDALCWSPDRSVLVVGTSNGAVLALAAEDGRELRSARPGEARLRSAACAPAGETALLAGEDGLVREWNLRSGASLASLSMPGRAYSISLSPDGRTLALPLAIGRALLVDRESRAQLVLWGHAGEVNAARFSRDGRRVATAGEDQTLRLWEVATGRPIWRAPLLLSEPAELSSHRGWTRLDGDSPRRSAAAPSAFRAAVEERAARGAHSPSGELACLATDLGRLELWDLRRDERLRDEAVPAVSDVLASSRGCVALSATDSERSRFDALLVPREGGSPVRLVERATAIALSGDDVLVAGRQGGLAFDAAGVAGPGLPGGARATALLRLAPDLYAFGYDDGTIELRSTGSRDGVSLDDVPPAAVVRLAAGPAGTLAAGFASGLVGLWSAETGTRLVHLALHGPAVHLLFAGDRLVAASELGDHVSLDLSVLRLDDCEVLRRVRAAVPVVWENGRAVLADEAPGRPRCGP